MLDPRSGLPGTAPDDYGVPAGERLNEVITQSWNRLRRHWAEFAPVKEKLPAGTAATGLTNDKWSLPLLRELGFGFLPTTAGPELGGRAWPINRFFGPVPIHLIGCGLSLNRRAAGQRGAASANPHGLVQEFLNRSGPHLWAIASNGERLRVLRDSQALSRQAFLEFDLKAMFEGEVYSDFVLLWLTVHATRFVPRAGGRPETCRLEQWTREAERLGTRALGLLRGGVEQALRILGAGFTGHRRNAALRAALQSGQLTPAGLHEQLLRVVYRLIFLFVAEDRTLDGVSLLHPPDESSASSAARAARERYAAHYGTARLRRLAGRIKGSRHGDLWRQFRLLVGPLSGAPDAGAEAVRRHLALPELGSFLWDPASTGALNGAELTNFDFLEALRHLAFTRQDRMLRPVDYHNLGAEELGGVYESLLALTPQVNGGGGHFSFAEFAGNRRKASGAYYTPDALVQCLLDSALDPIIEAATRGKTGADAEQAILSLKVCDPAVGSGHFLVGAAHRLARHLARARAYAAGESEPSPPLYQRSLRDVIGRCLYGVDVDPMAVELCRFGLWIEALQPGKPFVFLDRHVVLGDSLLGATTELIEADLPDAAFKPIPGDVQSICAALRKRNRTERDEGQRDMGFVAESQEEYDSLASRSRSIDQAPDDTLDEVRAKDEQHRRLRESPYYLRGKEIADAWCAAFLWPKRPGAADPLTTDTLRRLREDAKSGSNNGLSRRQREETERLANRYRFFHWHLAFPDVFDPALPSGARGFDCVLGNPPWELVKLQEKEWFAGRSPEIAAAPNAAARKRMIAALAQDDPALHRAFEAALRVAAGRSRLLRDSGRFPLCGRGTINFYAVFAELMRSIVNERGRAGCVLPTGISTDDTTKDFFRDVVAKRSLVSLFDFENKGFFFPEVHSSFKFCLFTAGGGARPTADRAEFLFFAHAVDELRDPERRFTLSGDDIALLNPNTQTCPIFRSGRDAALAKAIYRRVPVLAQDLLREQFAFSGCSTCPATRTSSGRGSNWKRKDTGSTATYSALRPGRRESLDHEISDHVSHVGRLRALPNARGTGSDGLRSGRQHLPRAARQGSSWRIRFRQGLFNMSSDSHLFHTGEQLEGQGYTRDGNVYRKPGADDYLPLYEAKMVHHYDHRWATYDGSRTRDLTPDEKQTPEGVVFGRYWVRCGDVQAVLDRAEWDHAWLLGVRNITNSTNERTIVGGVFPVSAVGNSLPVWMPGTEPRPVLPAVLSSLACDYAARLKVGGTNFNFFIARQIPVIPPDRFSEPTPWSRGESLRDWLLPRILELTYTAWDLQPFARDCGHDGPPFRWDDKRRFLLRCELDAACFHLYLPADRRGGWLQARRADGCPHDETDEQLAELTACFPGPRDAVAYMIDTFPILRGKDEKRYGEYRTKRVILDRYDAMQHAAATGDPYHTTLDPPPADRRCCHPPRTISVRNDPTLPMTP